MFRNYKSVFEKKVLVEKTVDFNKQICIYTVPKLSLKTEVKQRSHQEMQKNRGLAIARQFELKPLKYYGFTNDADGDIFSRQLVCLLKAVELGAIKHIYVYEREYLYRKNKYICAFIINYLENKKVTIYDRRGIVLTNYEDYSGMSGVLNLLKDYDSFQGYVKTFCFAVK